jgi:sulfite reductase (ferredoxin)
LEAASLVSKDLSLESVNEGLTTTSGTQEAGHDRMFDGPSKPTESIDTALSKAEKRKLYSGHLREPLLTELGNDEIRFSEDAVQLLKFHGSYQQNHRELRKTDKIKSRRKSSSTTIFGSRRSFQSVRKRNPTHHNTPSFSNAWHTES